MALLYVFTITHPVGVDCWPPAVHFSDYQAQRTVDFRNQKYMKSTGLSQLELNVITDNYTDVRFTMIFDDEAALQAYVNQTAIPDELQAAVDEWKTTYNITYDHKVYQLPEYTPTLDIAWVK